MIVDPLQSGVREHDVEWRAVLFAAHSATSACTQVRPGCASRAAAIIAAELSSPITSAMGQRSATTCVLLPGPQPRSITRRGASIITRTANSRQGRVRSSANRK